MTEPGKYTKRAISYENEPAQVKHREARNKARREAGHVKGDIAHKVALANKGTNTKSNLHVESIAKNRGWRKGQKGYKVPNE